MAPLRVVLLIPKLDDGGPEAVFFELAHHFFTRGMAVTVLTYTAGGRYFSALTDAGVRVEALGATRFEPRLLRRYPAHRLLRRLQALAPQVVLATQGPIALLPWWRGREVALVQRPANPVGSFARLLAERAPRKASLALALELASLRRSDHLVAQSDDIATDLVSRGVRVPIAVIPNPMPTHRLALPHGMQPRLSPRAGRPWLVSVGRLSPQKRYADLLHAFAIVRAEHPHASLTIVGAGEEEGALRALAATLGIDGMVDLPGHVWNPWGSLADADAFVSSSEHEGFPNVLLEALAVELPLVATDCPGGSRDIVREGVNGALAEPSGPAALAAAILRLLSRTATLRPASERRRDAQERFSLARVGDAYLEVLGAAWLSRRTRR